MQIRSHKKGTDGMGKHSKTGRKSGTHLRDWEDHVPPNGLVIWEELRKSGEQL